MILKCKDKKGHERVLIAEGKVVNRHLGVLGGGVLRGRPAEKAFKRGGWEGVGYKISTHEGKNHIHK